MAQLPSNWNADEHEAIAGFEPIETGWYLAVVESSERKATSKGTGSYLEFTLQIIEGASKGRKLWARMNDDNPNPKAVEIGKKELAALCRAAKKPTAQDTAELHGIPIDIRVVKKKRTDTGELTNEVKNYAVGGDKTKGAKEYSDAPDGGASKPVWAR